MDEQNIVEVLKNVTHEICNTVSENGKRHETALLRAEQRHDEITLKVEKRHEDALSDSEKRNEELSKKQHWATLIAAILGAIVAFIIFIFTSKWSAQASHTDAMMHRQAIQANVRMQQERQKMDLLHQKENILLDQMHEVQSKIDVYFGLRNQLVMEMAKMRGIIDFGQKYCKNGQYAGNNPFAYNEKLYTTSYHLIGIANQITGIFNDDIKQKTIQFLIATSPDSSKICAKNADTTQQLEHLQVEVNTMMLTSIQQLKEQKSRLEKELKQEIEENKIGS